MFILIVFAYYVLRYDVSVIEKLLLTLVIAIAALLPTTWPQARIACAIAQGVFGIYIVLRMHCERGIQKKS